MQDYGGLRGYDILQYGALNKSTAFTGEEREALGLRGLLPPAISTQALQVRRVMENLRRKSSDIDRYVFLSQLQDRNERLFYRTVLDHITECLPIIYTPTVGEACKQYAHTFRKPRGFFITPDDRGEIRKILDNWPEPDVRVIVVTDGERILGLGDLGANGIGIPIGKASLYVACGGIEPRHIMPVMLDVGTNDEALRNDPLYLGCRHPRLTGRDYDSLIEEFVLAVKDRFPGVLIQFEDFHSSNAARLLTKYRDRVLCFNDDIQGTAAVVLAGIYAGMRITHMDLRDLKVMMLGAGSAALGIADLLVAAFMEHGFSAAEARARIWLLDSQGLITTSRQNISTQKAAYAVDQAAMGLLDAIAVHRPHVLIGATGTPGTFTESAVRLMNELPVPPMIFALSNPTSRAECTAAEAYEWTGGRAIFASGSPFPAMDVPGVGRRVPGQGNNAYIFPAIGLAALAGGVRALPDELFLAAARTLSDEVSANDLETGTLYPALPMIREVSVEIAAELLRKARGAGLTGHELPEDLQGYLRDLLYDPAY